MEDLIKRFFILTDQKNICMCEVTRNLKAFANKHIRKMKPWIPESDIEETIVVLIRQGYRAFLSEVRKNYCVKHAEKKCLCTCANATLVYEDLEVLRRKTKRGTTSPSCICGKDTDERSKVVSETKNILNSLESYMHLNKTFRMRLKLTNEQKLSEQRVSIPTKIRRRNNTLETGNDFDKKFTPQNTSAIPKLVPSKRAWPKSNASARSSTPVDKAAISTGKRSNIPIKCSTPLGRSLDSTASLPSISFECNLITSVNNCCPKHSPTCNKHEMRPKLIPKRSMAPKIVNSMSADFTDDTETAQSDTGNSTEASDLNDISSRVSGLRLTGDNRASTPRGYITPVIFSKVIQTLKTDFYGVQEQWKNFKNNFYGHRM